MTDTGDGVSATALSAEETLHVTILNLVELSGRVFDDRDNDGQFDPDDGDNGLAGMTMELVQGDTVIDEATTSEEGLYDFQNVAEGIYTIRQQTQPTGFLDGLESTGDLGGDEIDNGGTVATADSNEITGVVIGAPGTQFDADGYDFAELLPVRLQGLAWEDLVNNSEVDFGETAIEGIIITLTGTDDRGNSVMATQTTNDQGIFEFVDLDPDPNVDVPLRPGTYTITQTQPNGFVDGYETLGEVLEESPGVVVGSDGIVDADTIDPVTGEVLASSISGIVLVAGCDGINYNFGERVDGGQISSGQTATIGFWQNKNGQALIKSLNGSEHSTLLAEWLADTFPNMYGSVFTMGTENTDVAITYQGLFKRNGKTSPGGPPKLDAQVMAVALATYVTKESLSGLIYDDSGQTCERFLFTDVDQDGVYEPQEGDTATIFTALIAGVESYGFDVTLGGVGSSSFNISGYQAAFGVAEGVQEMQIIDLLLATDSMSFEGLLYDGDGDGEIDDLEQLLRILANDVYSAINELGNH